MGEYYEAFIGTCPDCGSNDSTETNREYTGETTTHYYKCDDCPTEFKVSVTISSRITK